MVGIAFLLTLLLLGLSTAPKVKANFRTNGVMHKEINPVQNSLKIVLKKIIPP